MELATSMPANTEVPTSRRLICAAPCGEHQRQQTQNEGNRGHHHRAKPHARAERRGLPDRHARLALLLGEFDDQDAVLGRQRDQHDQADLRVEIERQSGDQDAA